MEQRTTNTIQVANEIDALRQEMQAQREAFEQEKTLWSKKAEQEAYLNDLDKLIRSHLNSPLSTFAEALLQSISQKMDAVLSAFYIVYHTDDKPSYIDCVAGYGIVPEKHPYAQKKISLGEGLVG